MLPIEWLPEGPDSAGLVDGSAWSYISVASYAIVVRRASRIAVADRHEIGMGSARCLRHRRLIGFVAP